MQYEQKLSHPRMMEMNPLIPAPPMRLGITSRYVSVEESSMLMAFSPFSAAPKSAGRSRYASGPATTSTPYPSMSLSFILSAMHPMTATIMPRPSLRRIDCQ